mmetsp:Transcript_12187/g.21731  ORF Transcript_12187/g.21731 Transcript_12187/m.21731 type:complete len:172 (-) Transcript_12187:216-731(-)|eukprot:CAMPEP_0201884980 /NCGR_PEP_ID=MMETSP0902-20130614/17657_1 /ASSEMBLY_ACC=CAM_ASM_000551 /TAXON_ID=420261 /ORGANISM="Thalassiosira antarctica, Strain CCMP982" /LENGTH=171 /DNA_ID=CAMNT_0048414003 /DNA_START=71 /DNA_END=586 /DNA_ORIENTATION=+
MDAGQPTTSSGSEANNNRASSAVNAPRPVSSRQDLPAGRGGGGATISTGTTTETMVLQQNTGASNNELPVLRLSLRPRSNVSWDEGVVNNEGLGRKSSKRCCIFHKQRAFGESSTESSEDDSGDDGSTSSSSSGGEGSGKAQLPMARKKNKKKRGGIGNKPKVPDYQRHHA